MNCQTDCQTERQTPKRVLLIVFSGTRNTLLVAEMFSEHFRKMNIPADIFDITGTETKPPLDGYDVIGLGYPIYAFNTPLFFLRYVKKLALRDKKVFIFKTSGEPTFFNKASSFSLIKILKNCAVLGDYHFLMPYNIIFRFPDNLIKQMYQYAVKYSGLAAANIINGSVSFVKYNLFHWFVSFIFKIQRLGFLNGKFYGVKKEKCTKCLICLRGCPAGNITLRRDVLHFGFKCQMCMRCSFFCPADAMIIGFLQLWKVNGPFRFKQLAADESLDGKFINEHTRGLYRVFIPYFKSLDQLFALRIPGEGIQEQFHKPVPV
ncbi:MAG: EFR1 family ferrodoxin [Treponema sp.]|nr:EFR1 family ferrodoxin [Treponema sp.]